MIISPARKFIFVHIPKTGGTALALALEDRAHRDDILIGDTPKARKRRGRVKQLKARGRLWKHSTLADIDGAVDLDDMFVLTLVRNPWDRMVSYYHWLRDQSFDHPAVGLAQAHDFSAFLNHPQTIASVQASPAASYVTDVHGRDRCALYARLEHLADDLAPFWTHLGFVLPVGRVNVSARKRDWRGYYSDSDAALVAQIAAPDIAQFGYRFDAESGD